MMFLISFIAGIVAVMSSALLLYIAIKKVNIDDNHVFALFLVSAICLVISFVAY